MMPWITSFTEPSPPTASNLRRPACSAWRTSSSPCPGARCGRLEGDARVAQCRARWRASRAAIGPARGGIDDHEPGSRGIRCGAGETVAAQRTGDVQCSSTNACCDFNWSRGVADARRQHVGELVARLDARRAVGDAQLRGHLFLLAAQRRVLAAVQLRGLLEPADLVGAGRLRAAGLALERLERDHAFAGRSRPSSSLGSRALRREAGGAAAGALPAWIEAPELLDAGRSAASTRRCRCARPSRPAAVSRSRGG